MALAAALAVSVLGGGRAVTGAAAIDPCALVTTAEAARALGGPTGGGEPEAAGGCTYQARLSPADRVAVRVDEAPGPERTRLFGRERARTEAIALAGVGDAAFATVSPAGLARVVFLARDTLVQVSLASEGHPDRLGAAAWLARAAAGRVGTAAAAARPSAVPALVGTWHARVEDRGGWVSPRLWTIRPGGDWTMTVAAQEEVGLVAEGGRWHMAAFRRDREGTYVLEGRDAFTSTGAFQARWTRVRDGRAPARVDPALLGARASVPRGAVREPGALDPRLVGLWEASATLDERPAELVWRIEPGGLATVTAVVSVRGRLDATDGRLTLRPSDEAPEPGTYRVLGRDSLETRIGAETARWQRGGAGPRR